MIGLLITMAIGNPVTASVVASHPSPEYSGSGSPQLASVLVSTPPTDLVLSTLPETTISASVSSSIEATVGDAEDAAMGGFFTNNWGALLLGLLGFADLVTRLTPTEKDNSILNFLSSILNAIIPNLKKGGGRL